VRPQEIILGLTGQSFFFDPPETFQPTGTPTVQVWLATNDDTSAVETATTGSCSVDSVATTITTTAAVRGDRTITVALGTGIARGRRYLITDTDGDCEWAEVMTVNGTTIGLRAPLVNDYAIGATFKGCRISIAVNSAWSSDANKLTDVLSGNWRTDVPVQADAFVGQSGYRLRWAYTVNGVATIGYSFADLVRYQSKNLVTPLDVDRRFPGWIDRLGADDIQDQGAAIVLDAFYAVKMDAMTDALLLRRVRNTEVLRELVVYRANLIHIENQVMNGNLSPTALEAAQKIYTQRYGTLVREPKFPTDAAGGGASSQTPRLPATRR